MNRLNKSYLIFVIIFLLLFSSCTSGIIGTLTEARDYWTTGAQGEEHVFIAFCAMKANLPIGILTEEGKFIYLGTNSQKLANYADKIIKVEGKLSNNGRVMIPDRIWVKTFDGWEEISLSN